jgi:hypothetical protein
MSVGPDLFRHFEVLFIPCGASDHYYSLHTHQLHLTPLRTPCQTAIFGWIDNKHGFYTQKYSVQHIAWEQGCVISSVSVPSPIVVHSVLTGSTHWNRLSTLPARRLLFLPLLLFHSAETHQYFVYVCKVGYVSGAGPDSPFWGFVHPVWSKWPLLFLAHTPVAPHPTTDTLPNGNIWLNRQQKWILHPKNSLQHIAWEQGCVMSSVSVPSPFSCSPIVCSLGLHSEIGCRRYLHAEFCFSQFYNLIPLKLINTFYMYSR